MSSTNSATDKSATDKSVTDNSVTEETPSSSRGRVIGFVIVLAALFAAVFFLPVAEWPQAVVSWTEANPSLAWLVFIFAYIGACVLLLPGSLFTLAAGYLFGLGKGFALVSLASVAGASCAFLLGRYFARDWVSQKTGNNPKFKALDTAVAERGFFIVFLCRLSPVFPFNLLNYALGSTSVRFPSYVLGSWLGMMPGTLLYVYFGASAKNLAAIFSGEATSGGPGWILWVGLAATLILTVFITRFATQTLNAQLGDEDQTTASDAVADEPGTLQTEASK